MDATRRAVLVGAVCVVAVATAPSPTAAFSASAWLRDFTAAGGTLHPQADGGFSVGVSFAPFSAEANRLLIEVCDAPDSAARKAAIRKAAFAEGWV